MNTNIVAAKILLTGIVNSALKRDEKTIEEIIASCRTHAASADVSLGELKEVSKLRLCDLVYKKPVCRGGDNEPFYADGEPCEHTGCLNHITHPCENCGRIGGITPSTPHNCERDGHILYRSSDLDAPNSICDSNGEVCLAMCRICGKAESEL